MSSGVPITREGLNKLKEDLRTLEARRPVIREQIKRAREFGDLSENAEYHAAREDLGMLEAKINEISGRISRAVIVDPSSLGGTDVVRFGATVSLLDLETEMEEVYSLVGEGEDDFMAGKILVTSPMAQAMVGEKVKATFEFTAPNGKKLKFKILKIEY
ncbi:MAG TPA: transcription elongation factor GreA [Planctomycetota bacterium]|nr:transcription elongation factor GreA [Planctomycetota bacterium]